MYSDKIQKFVFIETQSFWCMSGTVAVNDKVPEPHSDKGNRC